MAWPSAALRRCRNPPWLPSHVRDDSAAPGSEPIRAAATIVWKVRLVVKDHVVRYVGTDVTSEARVDGWCDPAFAGVGDAFRANFADGLETGAALSVSVAGRPVVDLWGGWAEPDARVPWDRETVVCVFSCSKGLLALTALRVVEEGRLDLYAPVSRYWPEFGSGAKQS